MTKLVLHNYWRSSASHRVRIGLGLKDLAYDYVAINILKDDQKTAAYHHANPMEQVPTLEILEDDNTRTLLVQSLPILEYLDERWPDPTPLLPRDLVARARARALAEIVNSGIQPMQNLKLTTELKATGVETVAFVTPYITAGLRAFAQLAAPGAGRFSVGDSVSIADLALIPQLQSARRFKCDLTPAPFAQLLEIEARCLALPAFANAMPDRQPDAVKA